MRTDHNPRVFTVVLNYRHADDTVRCVRSLQQSTYRNHRLLVVDNTEHPDSTSTLRDLLLPEVEVVWSGGNLGYAGGNNVGIRRALAEGSEFVWIVNPDTLVEPTTLAVLVRSMTDTADAAAIGPRILRGSADPPRIWFDGGTVDWSRAAATSHRNDGKLESEVPSLGVVDVDYVTGAALLLRSRALHHVGLIPEDYFLYFEETDLCQRLLRAGWRVIIDDRARMTHYKRSAGVAPTPYYVYYMVRNRLHFAARWAGLSVDETLPHVSAWLRPIRRKISTEVPSWLPTFDELVEHAVADARANRWGPRDDVAAVPTAEELLHAS